MELWSLETLWPAFVLLAMLLILLFHKILAQVGRVLLRSVLGFGFLFLWSVSGLLPNLALGVNVWNSLALGVLGLPGFGLLLLLRCLSFS